MGLLVKKDIGLGDVVDNVYVRANATWRTEPNEWEIGFQIYLSKKSREIEVIRNWLEWRTRSIVNPVDFNEEVANQLFPGISEEEWHSVFDAGPWTDVAGINALKEKYNSIQTRPIQSLSYATLEIGDFPTIAKKEEVMSWVYEQVKEGKFFHILTSPQLTELETKNSIKDDLESKIDIIKRYGEKESLLLEKLDTEGAIFTSFNRVSGYIEY